MSYMRTFGNGGDSRGGDVGQNRVSPESVVSVPVVDELESLVAVEGRRRIVLLWPLL